jgi:DNA-binding CsgD family transcriptional regulator
VCEVARRSLTGRAGPPARALVRASSGRWLVVEGASLRDVGPGSRRAAVVIQPAHRSELAPLLAERYELTERERELTELLARGLTTDAIAAGMGISWHTVRDHVKAVFAKLDVTSRAELTALLFYEHVLPGFGQRAAAR